MRDGVDKTAIDQAQPRRGKRRVDTDAVGAIAVEQKRVVAVAPRSRAVQQGNRNIRAVRRASVKPLAYIILRCKAAEHFLLLEQRFLPRRHVVIVDRQRRLHRRVLETQGGCIELQIDVEIGPVCRLVEFEIMTGTVGPRKNTNLGQAPRPLFHDELIPKQLEVTQINVIAMRNHLPPLLAPRFV